MSAELEEALAFIRRNAVKEQAIADAWWRQRRARAWSDLGLVRPSDVDRAIDAYVEAMRMKAASDAAAYARFAAMFADPRREDSFL